MKKGFTLIELLGVIVLLGVIGLIVYPIVNSLIKNGQEKSYQENISIIEQAAYRYSIENDLGSDSEYNSLSLSILKNAGFLKDSDIIDPTTNNKMTGCVFYQWDSEHLQYIFKYDDECIKP